MSIPVAQSIQVTSSAAGTSAPFTAAFVPSTGGNFLTVTPSSGNTPATITLSVNAAVAGMLAAGTYSGDVQVSSGTGAIQTVKVTLLVSPAGTPVVLAITSGASLQPGAVSPGEIVTIFGNGIGPVNPPTGTSFTPTATGTVPTTLANVTITFNNVPAPLIFVSQDQINAIVPYEVAGQTSVPVVVTNNGTASASFTVPVTAVAPAIFALSENGSGQGAIANSDASVNGTGNPAAPGQHHFDLCHRRRPTCSRRVPRAASRADSAASQTGSRCVGDHRRPTRFLHHLCGRSAGLGLRSDTNQRDPAVRSKRRSATNRSDYRQCQ